jgi:hypothetical protein
MAGRPARVPRGAALRLDGDLVGLEPGILSYRRTHGLRVPTGEPVRSAKLTTEEFDQLPVNVRVAVLREHRPGYWSKLGRQSAPRTEW